MIDNLKNMLEEDMGARNVEAFHALLNGINMGFGKNLQIRKENGMYMLVDYLSDGGGGYDPVNKTPYSKNEFEAFLNGMLKAIYFMKNK